MFKRFHRLMDEATDGTEGAGGGAGAVDDKGAAGSEDLSNENVDWKAKYEELNKNTQGLVAKKEELLGKVKEYKTQIQSLEEIKKQKEVEKAEVAGDKDKLLEFAKAELEELKQQLADRDAKETEKSTKLLQEAKVAQFKKALGNVDFYDESDALSSVEFDKFVMENDADGNPIGFNQTGVKEAVSKFMEKYHYKIKPSDKELPQGAAKGGKTSETLTDKDRIKKYLLNK